MTLLIVGSSGLVGRHVVAALPVEDARDTIVRWCRDRDGDFLNTRDRRETLRRFRPNKVLQLGWANTGIPSYEFHPDHDSWMKATAEFIGETREADAWIGVVSSVADSRDSPTGMSPYRRAKMELRERFAHLGNDEGVALFRPSYLFSQFALRPRVLRDLLLHPDPLSFKFDSPDRKHDFIHAIDAGSGIVQAMKHGCSGEINVCTGRLISVREFAGAILNDVELVRPDQAAEEWGERSKETPEALLGLGWKPTMSISLFRRHQHNP